MASKTKKPLEKTGWSQSFVLVGNPCVTQYTFKIDERSQKSDWIYNGMNLDVDCGEKYGKVRCEMMGGYGADRDNVIFVHGKTEDGSDDFENSYTIDWEDRFDEDYLKDLGRLCFIEIGVEKDKDGNVVIQRFLSQYDAIKYLDEVLTDDMKIKVFGQLQYRSYMDQVQVRKNINRIYLAKDDEEKNAEFTQTVLINKHSIGKVDNKKCSYPITGYILEKFKEYNGNDLTEGGKVRGGKFVPLFKGFEYAFNPDDDPEKIKKIIDILFKVKKGITQITYRGNFVEGGAVINTTYGDLPEDIRNLVDIGVYTLDDALATSVENKGKECRMLLKQPLIRMVGDEGSKVAQVQKFEEKYTEDDLILDYLIKKEDPEDESDEDDKDTSDESVQSNDLDDTSWMDALA